MATENKPTISIDGQTYPIRLTTGRLITLRNELDYNLIEFADPALLANLMTQPELLGDVLHCLTGKAVVERDAWHDVLGGAELHAGYEAVKAAIADVCQPAERGRAFLVGVEQVEAALAQAATSIIDNMQGPEAEAMIEAGLQRELAKIRADLAAACGVDSSPTSPSPASIPTPGHGANSA